LSLETRIASWNGFGVVARAEPDFGAWLFIALHDATLGPCTGGTRIRVYPDPEAGLEDAQRLGEGMTYKWAAIDFPAGGGKGVIALSAPVDGEARRELVGRYGALVAGLGGTYRTGRDLGAGDEDIRRIWEVAGALVHGVREDGSLVDPGPFTALGVLHGMRAAVRHRLSSDLSGRTVLVQGVGDVGAPLARLLADEGARVRVSDVDGRRAAALAGEIGAEVVDPAGVAAAECEVYAPCAVGAVLDRDSIARLRCAVVAGSANNQLAGPDDATRLLERGIVYVPDFVVNAGGAIRFVLPQILGAGDEDAVVRRVEEIGALVTEVLEEADRSGESPAVTARRRAERNLERARAAEAQGAARA
jgi:leucine dehydrogenase